MKKFLQENKARNSKAKWHLWFAWHPIHVQTERGDAIVWLEKVCRKHTYGYDLLITEYSLNFDLIQK